MRYEPSDECYACRTPKRFPGCHAVCPVGIKQAEKNAERYAETLEAVRAIPDHKATNKRRDAAAKSVRAGRLARNR
jgi:hypothetical protein